MDVNSQRSLCNSFCLYIKLLRAVLFVCCFFQISAPKIYANVEDSSVSKTELIEERKNYESRIKDLEQQLERAHFTKVAMEDNLRQSIFPNEEKADLIWPLLIVLNLLVLSFFVYYTIRKAGRRTIAQNFKHKPLTNNSESELQLTEREMDVLNLIVGLKSNPEISKELFISRNTTKTHVANILRKLEVSNRQEAASKALELELVEKNNDIYSGTLSKIGLLILLFSIGGLLNGQTIIDNQTTCNYLIKVNILAEGSCKLFGEGPLLKVNAESKLKLPKVPKNSWIVAYGIEEIAKSVEEVTLVGNPACNFRSLIKSYGSCEAVIKYNADELLITNEK